MISLQDVSLNLAGPNKKQIPILRNISLHVQPGEMVSITGPSGSGKTSLLMLIAGIEQASSGAVHVAGHDITHLDEDQLAAFRSKHLGVVFQNFHLIPTMTALENVALPLELSGVSDARNKAASHLHAVGLSARLDHEPSQLSGGEQQRVALARAFVTKPDVLLADEPTGNLDEENGRTIVELLFSLQKECGTTLLLVTHDRHLAEQTSTQVVMRDGQLVA